MALIHNDEVKEVRSEERCKADGSIIIRCRLSVNICRCLIVLILTIAGKLLIQGEVDLI